jgi:hypothetical protein
MRDALEHVLALQPSWTADAPNEDMALRGLLIRGDVAAFVGGYRAEIADRLLCAVDDVEVAGKDSTGSYSRVPWVRFANRQLSKNPREGWYVVYLFAEDGSEVALSLNQGTQVWDGVGMRSRPEASIRRRSDWARAQVSAAISARPRSATTITLGTGDKSRAYAAGNVVAYRYPQGGVPSNDHLGDDLLDMAELLQLVYRAQASMPVPGDPAPEIVAAEHLAQGLAGRRAPARTGFRANGEQRRAIELHAMKLATAHYEDRGAAVKDVSANHPYDLKVTLNGTVLAVEVKGTAGDGAEVLLTRGEVEHHGDAHPANALVVVTNIRLEGPPDAPEAVGGDVRIIEPWALDPGGLTPIAYRYRVPT